MRLLRTMLFTPGNNWRMIQKTKDLAADAIILDLEDSVPMMEKETARIFVADGVREIGSRGKKVFVRVNSLSTGLTKKDIQYSVQKSLDGIVLAKTESEDDVLQAEKMILEFENETNLPAGSITIIPLIETAKGIVNLEEIARASNRVIALCFGALDFTRDMGTTQSMKGTEIFYARSRLAIVAKAYDIQAIDTPWFDLVDVEGLIEEGRFVKSLGFKGKLLIHPDHIEVVNRIFTPDEKEVRYAERVVMVFKEANERGLGAASLDGKMIDIATYRKAMDVLEYVKMIRENESE